MRPPSRLRLASTPANTAKPGERQRSQSGPNSFEVVARAWYGKHSPNWSPKHGDRIIRRLERDIFPWIGGNPIADISAPRLLEVIRRIEQRGAVETAHRALGNSGQVFRYAVATGRAERDPSGDLRGALPPVKGQHFASVTDPNQVVEVLRALDGYEGTLTVRCALRRSSSCSPASCAMQNGRTSTCRPPSGATP